MLYWAEVGGDTNTLSPVGSELTVGRAEQTAQRREEQKRREADKAVEVQVTCSS